jgi:adenylate cyclase
VIQPAAWLRRHSRALVTLLAGVLVAIASLATGHQMNPIDGFLYDLSLSAESGRPGHSANAVAVIAVDKDSLDSPELSPIPRVFLGKSWAKLINGLMESNVQAVGFDLIFAYSANRFPGLDPQYDQTFLAALQRANSHIVLARTSREAPAPPFAAAMMSVVPDGAKAQGVAIASIEMFPDADGVQRRITASIAGKPTLASALLERAGAAPMQGQVLLAPGRPLEAIPTYALIDVLRCLERDPTKVRDALSGKIILVGSTLPDEDRKVAPDRFFAPLPARSFAANCSMTTLGASDPGSHTTPGVFIHAETIDEVVTGDLVQPLPGAIRAIAGAIAGIAGALLGLFLRPWFTLFGVFLLAGAFWIGALLVLPLGYWFPIVVPVGGSGGGAIAAYLTRFMGEERRRRRVQRAFSHYLAPTIVDRLAEDETDLRLGGERRNVSVMFADLSGFTALSSRVGPEELMEVTNNYLGLIVAEVEKVGGYVDKFIGDAVMAVWGAPLADPDHAAHAAQAALRSVIAVTRAKVEADAAGRPGYTVKMGINSGPAVIGNVGAPRRYNYTAIGETVNIAARLEGVPHDYDSAIVIGPSTAEAIAGNFVVCELDWIKLKGKAEPVAVYELLAEKGDSSEPEIAYSVRYAAALKLYRSGNFAAAEIAWRAIHYPRETAGPSTPPQIMADRCVQLMAEPPAEWDGVFVKTTK